MTEFAGVTKDKDRGITSRGGLYEFWTDGGAHIYLHDTDFRRLTYEPGRPPTLELEFLYDPQWTPPELSKTPVVVFRFEGVRLVEWQDEAAGVHRRHGIPRGQAPGLLLGLVVGVVGLGEGALERQPGGPPQRVLETRPRQRMASQKGAAAGRGRVGTRHVERLQQIVGVHHAGQQLELG
ncbi:hypothetical protein [Nonomuraea sp. NPDC049695]|uniref:hypothetical protein n=1 Tax=Nonomuraea sp. NPDC049695 TaxID=3154734 RepID=UPI00344891B8